MLALAAPPLLFLRLAPRALLFLAPLDDGADIRQSRRLIREAHEVLAVVLDPVRAVGGADDEGEAVAVARRLDGGGVPAPGGGQSLHLRLPARAAGAPRVLGHRAPTVRGVLPLAGGLVEPGPMQHDPLVGPAEDDHLQHALSGAPALDDHELHGVGLAEVELASPEELSAVCPRLAEVGNVHGGGLADDRRGRGRGVVPVTGRGSGCRLGRRRRGEPGRRRRLGLRGRRRRWRGERGGLSH